MVITVDQAFDYLQGCTFMELRMLELSVNNTVVDYDADDLIAIFFLIDLRYSEMIEQN